MAERKLNTRIQLRYASYSDWMNSSLKLLPGEVAVCYVEAANDEIKNTAPTVLFKVGDGEHTFSELQWSSARAADVYDWAKEPTRPTYSKADVGLSNVRNVEGYSKDEVDAKIQEIQGALEADTNTTYRFDLSAGNKITIYSKEIGGAEVKVGEFAVDFSALESEISTIKGNIETINSNKADKTQVATDIATAVSAAEGRVDKKLEAYEKTENLVSLKADVAANKAAVATVDSRIETAVSAAEGRVDTKLAGKVDVEGYVAFTSEEKEKLAAIEAEANKYDDSALKARVKAIEDDYLVEEDKTELKGMINSKADQLVVDGISQVANAAVKQSDYDVKVKALEDEDVRIAGLVSAEAERAAGVEAKLDGRLVAVETFFETVEGETIDEAMNTLVEIQKYITEDGQAADQMVKDIAANTKAISDEKSRAEGIEAGLASRIKTLEDNPYQLPEDVVRDGQYKHITVTSTSVSDGVNTFNKYDDTQLRSDIAQDIADEASRVDGLLEGKADKDAFEGLVDRVDAVEDSIEEINAKPAMAITSEEIGIWNGLPTLVEGLDGRVGALEQADQGFESRIAALEEKPFDTYATKEELKSTDDKVEAIKADYLKSSDKEALQGAINTEKGRIDGLVNTTIPAINKAIEDEAAKAREEEGKLSNRIKAYEDVSANILMSTDTFIFNCGGAE